MKYNPNNEMIKNAKPYTIICTQIGAVNIQNIYNHPLSTLILVRNKLLFNSNYDSQYIILDEPEYVEDVETNNENIMNQTNKETTNYEKLFYSMIE